VDRPSDLTLQEQANVRRALCFLAKRHGGYRKLAAAMQCETADVKHAVNTGKISAGIAMRAVRLAGVRVESILFGTWPASEPLPLPMKGDP
jgi:hypothetical protein